MKNIYKLLLGAASCIVISGCNSIGVSSHIQIKPSTYNPYRANQLYIGKSVRQVFRRSAFSVCRQMENNQRIRRQYIYRSMHPTNHNYRYDGLESTRRNFGYMRADSYYRNSMQLELKVRRYLSNRHNVGKDGYARLRACYRRYY